MAEPALRPGRTKPSVSAWQWARTAETRRALLAAAREVFVEQGFVNASIADVVQRADSSVGSLYHHFGGKSELFVALWQEHQQAHEEAASRAVAQARRAGVTDPFELFSAGARAFLEGSWQRRDLAMLFVAGDSPPGFEVMKRRRSHEWVGQNDALLKLPDTSFEPAVRGDPDVDDRRGRPRGGGGQNPAAGHRHHRRRDRVRPPADDRWSVEAAGQAGPRGGAARRQLTARPVPVRLSRSRLAPRPDYS